MIEVCGTSVCGPRRRNNEDSFDYRYEDGILVMAVADGLGGMPYGEIASGIAVSSVMDFIMGSIDNDMSDEDLEFLLDRAFNKANVDILRNCVDEPDHIGMSSTLTVGVIRHGRLTLSHFGDCRCYIVRDGRIEQLTDDHNLAGYLVRSGEITEEESRTDPGRSSLLNCLGENTFIRPDINGYDVISGDCVILATDGMYSLFEKDAFRDILEHADSPKTMCELLEIRGTTDDARDNSTVVAAYITE